MRTSRSPTARSSPSRRSFPLWQRPQQLAEMLRRLIAGAPKADHLAATMSGELADCYVTKAEGVQAIVQAFVTGCRRPTRANLSQQRHARRARRSRSSSRCWRRRPTGMRWLDFAGRYVPHGAGPADRHRLDHLRHRSAGRRQAGDNGDHRSGAARWPASWSIRASSEARSARW